MTDDPDVAGREPELRRDGVRGPVVVERHDEDGALALRQRRETTAEPLRVERLRRLLVRRHEVDGKRLEYPAAPRGRCAASR